MINGYFRGKFILNIVGLVIFNILEILDVNVKFFFLIILWCL